MPELPEVLDAKFLPPRNWSLDAPLKFKSEL